LIRDAASAQVPRLKPPRQIHTCGGDSRFALLADRSRKVSQQVLRQIPAE